MNVAQVLLVDDDPDNLEVLTAILGEQYRVLAYGSAPEALAALETARPDLVVLDIGMKPVDGLQCLRAIRAMPGFGRIPAVALTAYAREVEREAFLAAGFQAVVTKPLLDQQELFAAITPLLAARAERAGMCGAEPTPVRGHEQLSASRDGLTAPAGNGKILPREAQPSTPGSA